MSNQSLKAKIMEKKQLLIIIALLMVYLFWGGTYLGMKVALETLPPFIMAGIRYIIAGSVLYLWAMVSGAKPPKKEHWKSGGIVGALLLLGGNGLVAWAEQIVSSGIAALMVATVPLWMIILNWRKEQKPSMVVLGSTIFGFIGIAVLVLQPGGETTGLGANKLGILAILFATFSWSIGSLYSRKAQLPKSQLLSVAIQMLVGGGLLLITATILGEWSRFELANISSRSFLSMGYLIIFGSIIAYNAYIWLLKNADPTWVSTYAFVNPIIAVLLGWAFANEKLTVNSLIAAIIIITAVIIITIFRDHGNLNKRKKTSLPS